jgi:hypothetical protein
MFRLFWQEFQTAGVALLAAILIWVFADSATVSDHTIPADVQLVSPPDKALLIDPPLLRNVSITFQGSASQLAQMQSRLLRVEVDAIPGNPLQTLNLRALLPNAVADLGVHITDVGRVGPIHIESLVRRDLPVDVLTGDMELADTPRCNVKQVTVQLPEHFVQLVEQKNIEVVADLQHRGPNAPPLQDNVEQSAELPLVLTARWGPVDDDTRELLSRCKPDPATATITFTPRHRRDKLHNWSVPITLDKPPSVDENFFVKLVGSDTIPADLEGPAYVIDQIRKGTVQVRAQLVLKFEDFPIRGETPKESKAILWQMPPDVKVLSPTPEPTVYYSITERRRDPAPAPPTPAAP